MSVCEGMIADLTKNYILSQYCLIDGLLGLRNTTDKNIPSTE